MIKNILWKDLKIGDIFAEDLSIVLAIGEWQNQVCYKLINNETKESLIVSKDHLIALDRNNKDLDKLKEMELTKLSKNQVNEKGDIWGSVEDIYNLYGNDAISINKFEFSIEPYENLKPQTVRCITTTNGTYTINGFLNHNSSRGNHTLDGMKEIVANLLDAGMDDAWISRNLYLDKEAIQRYKVLSGLAQAFKDEDGFSKDVWDPKKDRLEERKNQTKLLQLARQYVRQWKNLLNEDGGNFDIPESLDLLTAAKNIGFDPSNPYVIPTKVDKQTGEVLVTELKEITE